MRLNEIYRTYKDQVEFLAIYIREAHPDDGWRVGANLDADIRIREPVTDDERAEVAEICQIGMDLQMPMLIDSIDNDVEEKYIAIPMRLFLITRDGKIAYTGDEGPRGWDADGWEEAIKAQLGK